MLTADVIANDARSDRSIERFGFTIPWNSYPSCDKPLNFR